MIPLADLHAQYLSIKNEIDKAVEDLQGEISSIEVSGTGFSKVIQNSVGGVVSVLTNTGQGSGA